MIYNKLNKINLKMVKDMEYNNDLTFFTNEGERNLYDRFCKVLNKNTEFFDVLVGYFRASGFYLLQDSLEKIEKTRILRRKYYKW